MIRMINGSLMVSSRRICKVIGNTADQCFASIESKTFRYVDFKNLVDIRSYRSQHNTTCWEAFVSLEGLKWILDHSNEFTARRWTKVSEIIKEIYGEDYPLPLTTGHEQATCISCEGLEVTIKELRAELKLAKDAVCALQVKLTGESTANFNAWDENSKLRRKLEAIQGILKAVNV